MNTANVLFIMLASILVFFMTPGLAFFSTISQAPEEI